MDPKVIQTWQDKLAALLARAAAIKESGEDPIDLAREVEAFASQHPVVLPEDSAAEQFEKMDEIARNTHDALISADINQRITSIAEGTAELAKLTGRVGAQSATNVASAKSISLEQLTSTVSAATDALNAIKELQTSVKAQTGAPGQVEDLTAKLATAVAALQAFKTAAEGKG